MPYYSQVATHKAPSGMMEITHNAVAAASTVKLDCRGYNSVLLFHDRVSGTAYTTVILRQDETTNFVVHPAPSGNSDWGLNVRTTGATTDAIHAFKGITPFIGVALNWTSGTHTVRAMPINV